MIDWILKKLIAKRKERSYLEYRKKVRPSISLHKNIKTQDFVIIEWAAWTLTHALPRSQGPLIKVSHAVMKSKAKEIITKSLNNYGFDGPKAPSQIDSMEKTESQKFHREHLEVNIQSKNDNTVQVWPMRRRRNDRSIAVGEPEDMSEISFDCTEEEFFQEIELAFERAK
ncbi:hypothetical protein KP001_01405 [Geomonas subterranea]|uniref:Uncharacterized protein n=1 Tax=Geomonas subterranea TaxID=2847989 RepID=A0ABX8LIR9_9BACT|nr:hypothetical protein [Geomonas subterranea]QXE91226.1 hypothetical protein KP001_01405 [Geomonas subterranea]QXM10687.1 hypothetical protein KP002_06085 [Geomonas subterranea]